MLKIVDHSGWKDRYLEDLATASKLLQETNSPFTAQLNNIDLFELLMMARNPSSVLYLELGDSYLESTVRNAGPLWERYEDLVNEYPGNGLSLFLQMSLLGPLSLLVRIAGEANVHISSYHGFTSLQFETTSSSVRAKISHHQADPTLVYGIPDALKKAAWQTTQDNRSDDLDRNGFQAIFDLPKLDSASAIDAIISSFCDGIQNSIHNLEYDSSRPQQRVRVQIDCHDDGFDEYLLVRNSMISAIWSDSFSNVYINRQEPNN